MTFATLIASGAGAGYARRAPGTAGSALGLMIGAGLLGHGHGPLLLGIVAASAAGIWAIRAGSAGAADPGWIVIDEIAGQMIALFTLPRVSMFGLLLAFGLFRLFDIKKPGLIGWADARHDEWGVMGDDWIAGIYAALCILAIGLLLPGLLQ